MSPDSTRDPHFDSVPDPPGGSRSIPRGSFSPGTSRPDPRAFVEADIAFTRYNARRALQDSDTRMEQRRFGDATALRDKARTDAYYNRVIGMSPRDVDRLPDMIAWFAELSLPCRITLDDTPPEQQLKRELEQRGFVEESQDAFLSLRCSEVGEPEPQIEVRQATSTDLDDVFDLWQEPGLPQVEDAVRNVRRAAQMDAHFVIYLAHLNRRPVAMGTLFQHGALAWLGNANTLPAFRGRGCQSALLRRRMWDARQRGLEWVITDAELGSTSYRNAERAGLRPSFITTTLNDPSR